LASEIPHPKGEPKEPVPDYQQALSNLSNPELLSAPAHRGTPAGCGGRRVASHQHPPRLERRVSPTARAGGFLGGTLVRMQNATTLFTNVVEGGFSKVHVEGGA
jgi:hypothetical protein